MKQTVADFHDCANCGACLNVCPVNAVCVGSEDLFYKITVDEEKCIGCGKCVKVCPVNTPKEQTEALKAWYGRSRDRDTVRSSSSGGLFSVLAEHIIADGGIVFGACFDEDCRTVRIRNSDEVSMDELRRSKYVESLAGDSFKEVKSQLDAGRKVLFCATPCQIAGLKQYLGGEREGLITCDFACGGVPSHVLYQGYVRSLEEKYRSPVKAVNFRPKTYGWSIHGIRVDFENGRRYTMPSLLDPFFCGFTLKHVNTRDYCYTCRFAEQHAADISLADFWRYDTLVGGKNDEKGLSLILANTQKGCDIIAAVSDRCALTEMNVGDASYNVKMRVYSKEYMQTREKYLGVCRTHGLEKAAEVIGRPAGAKFAIEKFKCTVKGILAKIK